MAAYKHPVTESPSKEAFFDDIVRVKDDNLPYNLLTFDEAHILAMYRSGVMWRYDGGTNFWSEHRYKLDVEKKGAYDTYLTAT